MKKVSLIYICTIFCFLFVDKFHCIYPLVISYIILVDLSTSLLVFTFGTVIFMYNRININLATLLFQYVLLSFIASFLKSRKLKHNVNDKREYLLVLITGTFSYLLHGLSIITFSLQKTISKNSTIWGKSKISQQLTTWA